MSTEAEGFPPGEELDLGLPPRHISAEADEVTVPAGPLKRVLAAAHGLADPADVNVVARAAGLIPGPALDVREGDLLVEVWDNAAAGPAFAAIAKITHRPTGLVGMSAPQRSSLRAKAEAMKALHEALAARLAQS